MLEHKEIQDALNWRYATKRFDPTQIVDEAEIQGLLDAARLAPSSYGLQPWRFVLVRDPETRARLCEVAWNQSQVTDASHLIVLCRLASLEEEHIAAHIDRVETTRDLPKGGAGRLLEMLQGMRQSKPAPELASWMDHQVYIALGTLLTAAAMRGVDACPMEGFDPAKTDEILGLRERGLHSVILCALGRRSAEDAYSKLNKVRFPLEELVLLA